jgi:acyl-coenzyme A synthetase/AMP-(fatty) acid ligase
MVTSRPATVPFLTGRDREFLREEEQVWPVRRLLALAADIDGSIPDNAGPLIAIRSGSAAFILAALLGLWESRRCGLLLDPALREETLSLPGEAGRIILVPHDETAGIDGELPVTETGGDPLAPLFPEADDPFVAFFTSGSTGEPKLVRKRTYQLLRQLEVEVAWLGLAEPVSVLCLAPAHHILGFIYGLYLPATTGGTVSFLSAPTPQAWLRGIRSLQPQLVVGVPTHYRVLARILDAPLPAALYLCSGAPLSSAVQQSFEQQSGQPILQVYGSTETGGVAKSGGNGVWTPLPGLQWKIDGDSRLWTKSPWQDDPQGWSRTDDLAAPAAGGFALLGRADTIVKVGARRFSTEEIVRAARSLPEVEDAVALAYERYGEIAIALFATPCAEQVLDPEQIARFLQERLAAFKLPRTIRVLPKMPLMGIGKVDVERLRASLEQD